MALDVKPAFQAEKVTGNFFRMVMSIEEDVRTVGNGPIEKKIITRKLVPRREEFHEGYMIYFPQGHSLFVAADDEDQLQRIGVYATPPLVDMNSGEEVPNTVALSPKEIVANKQRNRPRANATGGLTQIMENDLDA
jgi:hypothetical protein